MLDKIKSLSKDTLIYGTSTIVGRFLNFLLVPLYTNTFLPGEFGIVANIYAYIAMLNVFFTIGMESGYFKFASTLEVGSKKENFSHPYLLIFSNALIFSSVLFFFSSFFSGVFQIDAAKAGLVRYTALILFFDAIVTVPFAHLRLQHRPKWFAFVKMVNIVINVVSNIVLIVFLKWGIESVFISNLIASVITFLLLSDIVIKNIKFTFNRNLFNELMKFSLPYIPAGISANVVQVINRPILTYLTDDATVGIFQANYRLGIFMMLFVSMFEFAWRPFFLQNAKEPNAKELFSKIMTLFILTASLIFLFLTVFIENIGKMKIPFKGYLIGKNYWGGLDIVPVILLAYIFYGIYINLMAGIYIEKKTKHLPLITGISAAAAVIFNLLLIPYFNMTGAAVATLLSYFVMMVSIYFTAQKFYRIEYEFKKILFIFGSLIICTALYEITGNWFSDFWFLKIVYILLFIALIFVFKVFSADTLRKLKIIK